ncbi:hypothetical protein, partial [Bacillus sp. 7894-2]|uniref:hypothetical protein n=1 Tax=Bacillus sp. 7894-2 TaxID=2021695 RepID=UPI001C528629
IDRPKTTINTKKALFNNKEVYSIELLSLLFYVNLFNIILIKEIYIYPYYIHHTKTDYSNQIKRN